MFKLEVQTRSPDESPLLLLLPYTLNKQGRHFATPVCDYSQRVGIPDSGVQMHVASTFPARFSVPEKWRLTLTLLLDLAVSPVRCDFSLYNRYLLAGCGRSAATPNTGGAVRTPHDGSVPHTQSCEATQSRLQTAACKGLL